jgi:hypothetical protein
MGATAEREKLRRSGGCLILIIVRHLLVSGTVIMLLVILRSLADLALECPLCSACGLPRERRSLLLRLVALRHGSIVCLQFRVSEG